MVSAAHTSRLAAALLLLLWTAVPTDADILLRRSPTHTGHTHSQRTAALTARQCATGPTATSAGKIFHNSSQELTNLDSLYAQFVEFHGGQPADADIALFVEDVSKAILSISKTKYSSTYQILRFAFDYRLVLSRIQRELCTPAWLMAHYEGFYNQLDAIVGPLKSRPTTLEGFLLSYRHQDRRIEWSDLRFIDQYMVDTPLNRVIRSVLIAHAAVPERERVTAVSNMCSEFERMANNGVISLSAAAATAALEKPACVSLQDAPGGEPVVITARASFFSVLKTNGADVRLTVRGSTIPIIDSSVSDPSIVLPGLAKRPGADAVALPLLVGIRRKLPDGGDLPFFDRFDKTYVIVHLVLKRAADAEFDVRPFPPARRGGNVVMQLSDGGAMQPSFAVLSLGQPGAVVAAPSEPGTGIESAVPPSRFHEFFFGEGADLLASASDRVLLLSSVTARQMSRLLLAGSSDSYSVPDLVVEVPIAWLQMLSDEQRSTLTAFCGQRPMEACLPEMVQEQLRRVLIDVFQFCTAQLDSGCDPKTFGVGSNLLLGPGKPGPRRPSGRDGGRGTLTIEPLPLPNVSGTR